MKRVEIIGLMSKAQGIVDTLQKRGAVELCNVTDEELVKMNTASVISDLEKKKASCLSAIETVSYTHLPSISKMLWGMASSVINAS